MAVQGNNSHGTMFSFTLPTTDETLNPMEYGNQVEREPGSSIEKSNAKILVAVPDSRTLGVVRRILLTSDYSIIATYDPAEIDLLTSVEMPQIVLLDLAVATENGFPLIRHLSQEYGVSVIVLSDRGDDENVARAFDLGADDYVVKAVLTHRTDGENQVLHAEADRPKEYATFPPLRIQRRDPGLPCPHFEGFRCDGAAHSHGVQTSIRAVEQCGPDFDTGRTASPGLGPRIHWENPSCFVLTLSPCGTSLGDNARNPSYIFTEHGIGISDGEIVVDRLPQTSWSTEDCRPLAKAHRRFYGCAFFYCASQNQVGQCVYFRGYLRSRLRCFAAVGQWLIPAGTVIIGLPGWSFPLAAELYACAYGQQD